MFGNGKKLDLVLDQYEYLVATFAAAIIEHPSYDFRLEDKKKFFNEYTQSFEDGWKYEVVMMEAKRYADAFLNVMDEA